MNSKSRKAVFAKKTDQNDPLALTMPAKVTVPNWKATKAPKPIKPGALFGMK